MKKLFFVLLLVLICSLSFTSLTNAQETAKQAEDLTSAEDTLETQVDENTTRATNKYFDLTLAEGLQSPVDKGILYTITIVPHIDSARTQIIWDSSSTITIKPKHEEFIAVLKDQTYTYKAKIKPSAGGIYNVSVSVISWQYDTNYTNTVTNQLTLSRGIVSQPITPEYTILVVIETIVILGISALAIWGGIELSKKYIAKAKVWLAPPR